MVPQQMIMAQAPWQLTRQCLFQIAFDEDCPCYKEPYYQKKEEIMDGMGPRLSFEAPFFPISPPSFFCSIHSFQIC
jgi:hypothetical protein